MKIVTDTAANLIPDRAVELGVEVVSFKVSFNGKTYRDGIDIFPDALYHLYSEFPEEFPVTSFPSVGDYISAFEKYSDQEIVSIQLSSGLSGSYSSAQTAADHLPHQRLTVVDSKSIGPAMGWMVEVAAHGAKAGWTRDRILDAVKKVRDNTFTTVCFSDIRYLVHSGRVSHLRGIIASVLKIKPIIGINYDDGRFSSLGQEISISRAVRKMANIAFDKFGSQKIKIQLMHGNNLPGVDLLRTVVTGLLNCVEDALVPVTTVIGAHAGPTVIGFAAIPVNIYESLLT